MTRTERLFVGVAAVSALAATAIANAMQPDGCRSGYTRSTETPIAVAAVIVFVSTALVLVNRNRDIHDERRGARYQVGQVATAALVALVFAALAQLPLD